MYRRIVTYNFESDETRNSFVELLIGLGFEEQPDQSTYAQGTRNPRTLGRLKNAINACSRDKELSEDDSVQIYFLTRINERETLIDRCVMYYSGRYSDLR